MELSIISKYEFIELSSLTWTLIWMNYLTISSIILMYYCSGVNFIDITYLIQAHLMEWFITLRIVTSCVGYSIIQSIRVTYSTFFTQFLQQKVRDQNNHYLFTKTIPLKKVEQGLTLFKTNGKSMNFHLVCKA